MSDRPIVGYCDGTILWHVDQNGNGGNDIIYGLDGADTIHGGSGDDTIYGNTTSGSMTDSNTLY